MVVEANNLAVNEQTTAPRRYLLKRPFDIVLALIAAPFAAVVVLLLAIVIKLGSPGAVLFRQRRVGQHGRIFICLKLRTMRIDTPDRPTHEVGLSSVTAIGRLLRGSRLDELPQVWNVLKGEMSFVGPRPCLPSQDSLISARLRLGVLELLPGITGVSQIAGLDMSDPETLAIADAAYLSSRSLATDIRLLFGTIFHARHRDNVDRKQ